MFGVADNACRLSCTRHLEHDLRLGVDGVQRRGVLECRLRMYAVTLERFSASGVGEHLVRFGVALEARCNLAGWCVRECWATPWRILRTRDLQHASCTYVVRVFTSWLLPHGLYRGSTSLAGVHFSGGVPPHPYIGAHRSHRRVVGTGEIAHPEQIKRFLCQGHLCDCQGVFVPRKHLTSCVNALHPSTPFSMKFCHARRR